MKREFLRMWKIWWYAISISIALFSCSSSEQPPYYNHATANLSTYWINSLRNAILGTGPVYTIDPQSIRPLLLISIPREAHWSNFTGLAYACGFYCDHTPCDSFLFSVFIVLISKADGPYSLGFPQVVWSANQNRGVKENASVELTSGGDLILRDADGTLVWSTNTAGKSVAGLNLTETGNLILYDANNSPVWQSFDHPTDCLLVGQSIGAGKNLTSSASQTDFGAGLYSVWMSNTGLVASVLSHPPQPYYTFGYEDTDPKYINATFRKGSLVIQTNTGEKDLVIHARSTNFQFLKLESDGHLRVLEWGPLWEPVLEIVDSRFGNCIYPMACGRYGICLNGQCACPKSTSFKQINDGRPDFGCSEVVPLACNASQNHGFVDLNYTTYFALETSDIKEDIYGTDLNTCKQIFSFMASDGVFNTVVSIKVQLAPSAKSENRGLVLGENRGHKLGENRGLVLGSPLGAVCVCVLIGISVFTYTRRRRQRKAEDVDEEDYLDQVPGMPTRFSFETLAAATNNFSNKLGEGGFGSVYEGLLNDGTRIAVKRLDGVGHIKKSFLTEVETISSIHHINLVRLIGFCAEKSRRLLVYEHMCNGSLDKWLYFEGDGEAKLDWNQRRKIILDVAKGLTYLHEECTQKIFHLDIKPQNILLDIHHNAKLADFGLSKLMDRNQSKLVTTMRGTPGYLAPEWLIAVITEKVDVYSFGVVILEILTGRRIFEVWRPEEEQYLLEVFKKKCGEGRWLDLVCRGMEFDEEEVNRMMAISAWCVQSVYEKRPSMSMVVKVMEGAMEMPRDIDYNLVIPHYLLGRVEEVSSHDNQGLTPLLPSVLSRPR